MSRDLMASLVKVSAPADREYSIGDMAAHYGVSLRTLRFYEDKGLLFPRRQGMSRFYSPKDRIRLELILKGKRLGFSLSEIHDLIASRRSGESHGGNADKGETADLVVSLNHAQVAAQIAHLERQRDELTTAIEELREAHRRMCDVSEAVG